MRKIVKNSHSHVRPHPFDTKLLCNFTQGERAAYFLFVIFCSIITLPTSCSFHAYDVQEYYKYHVTQALISKEKANLPEPLAELIWNYYGTPADTIVVQLHQREHHHKEIEIFLRDTRWHNNRLYTTWRHIHAMSHLAGIHINQKSYLTMHKRLESEDGSHAAFALLDDCTQARELEIAHWYAILEETSPTKAFLQKTFSKKQVLKPTLKSYLIKLVFSEEPHIKNSSAHDKKQQLASTKPPSRISLALSAFHRRG